MKWHQSLGFGADNYRFHDHTKLAHYANAATDIEYRFPFGFKEVEGIHSRTDFDLSQHQEYSGKKIQYFDPEKGESYVPMCRDIHRCRYSAGFPPLRRYYRGVSDSRGLGVWYSRR